MHRPKEERPILEKISNTTLLRNKYTFSYIEEAAFHSWRLLLIENLNHLCVLQLQWQSSLSGNYVTLDSSYWFLTWFTFNCSPPFCRLRRKGGSNDELSDICLNVYNKLPKDRKKKVKEEQEKCEEICEKSELFKSFETTFTFCFSTVWTEYALQNVHGMRST